MVRRGTAAVALLAGAAAACTTFAFPRPDDSGDAAVDAAASDAATGDAPSGNGDAGDAPAATGTPFLSLDDAARFCTQLFRCPGLAEAVELSLAIPVNTPASPLSYSGCMDWLAAPVDPARPGLAKQQQILLAVASTGPAGSCVAAAAPLPVQPTLATTCSDDCASPTSVSFCPASGGAFSAACATPYYGQAGTCVVLDGGSGECVTGVDGGLCLGLSCSDTSTLVECHAPDRTTFTSYDCALSGRQCAGNLGIYACLVPGKQVPPCAADKVRDTCDGDSVLHCAGELLAQTEMACGAVGRTCSTTNPAGVARCVGAGDAGTCTPFDSDQSQCSGTSISLCIAGKPATYDCAGIGATCQPKDATHTAHCG